MGWQGSACWDEKHYTLYADVDGLNGKIPSFVHMHYVLLGS
jgi:hypothetical protein